MASEHRPRSHRVERRVRRSGELLDCPELNKGTAFTEEERSRLGLHGLLPPYVETLDEQAARAYEVYRRRGTDLERHVWLRALQDTNEVLFYRLLIDHIEEMAPVVHVPTVAAACRRFNEIYRRPRGLFISYPRRHEIGTLLNARRHHDVDLIVVTDGEHTLGTGDLGVSALAIPIGKLALYGAIGGIRPERTLSIALDVGTSNPQCLSDPEYIGWRHERVGGDAYYEFIELFVQAVESELPSVCLQWEDLTTERARPILNSYRDRLLTFNDDIQGTAAVALAAVLSALRVRGGGLRDQTIVLLGAASEAIGVADYLRAAMMSEGLSSDEARRRFWLVDKDGLLTDDRLALTPEQRRYVQNASRVASWRRSLSGIVGLSEVVANIEATVLIGASGAGGAFSESIVREMSRKAQRPIILPLSSAAERSEAKPQDLVRWTQGRGLLATGAPFPVPMYEGRPIPIAQCSSLYIFPAIALGVVGSGARRITDSMMLAAARSLSAYSPAIANPSAPLLPSLRDMRAATLEVAIAVATAAQHAGVANRSSAEKVRTHLAAAQWYPAYAEAKATHVEPAGPVASETTSTVQPQDA